MSSYLYFKCSRPGCNTSERIYADEIESVEFPFESYEGEELRIPCHRHAPRGLT